MTQKYALFFDIDGTLVSFQTHGIPASTILALTQAKANGSRVYIATGRPPLILTNLGAIEHLIDGYITTNGADKGKGILAMARHEGFDPSRTMAFGDGGNDTSMILQAGIGIAMGNAIDSLKHQADYVTTSVDDDGILNALRHFNVI